MRGIKANSCYITKSTDRLPIISCTDSIATIFDQPQIVCFAKCGYSFDVKWIAEGMGEHHCTRTIRQGSFQLSCIHIVCGNMHVYKNRYETILENWVDCRRKARSNGDNFITSFKLALA